MGSYEYIEEHHSIFYSGDGEGCSADCNPEDWDKFKRGEIDYNYFDWSE